MLRHVRPLGAGSYGRAEFYVYRGTLPLAVKLIARDDTVEVNRSVELAIIAAVGRLQAPAFPRFYGAGTYMDEDVHTLAIVMEFCGRGTLFDAMASAVGRSPERPRDAKQWYFAATFSLAVAQHQLHLDHRDLRLDNILFKDTPRALQQHYCAATARFAVHVPAGAAQLILADFGQSALLAGASDALHASGNPYSRDMASHPSPDLLFWPNGDRRRCGGDTWVLALQWFVCAVADACGGVYQSAAVHLSTAVVEGPLPSYVPELRDLVKHLARLPAPWPHMSARDTGGGARYMALVMVVQAALGNGALPDASVVPPGASALVDTLRASDIIMRLAAVAGDAMAAALVPKVEARYEPALVDLLARQLRWSTSVDPAREAGPCAAAVALESLQHAYFDAYRQDGVSLKRPVDDAGDVQWFELGQARPLNTAPLPARRTARLVAHYGACHRQIKGATPSHDSLRAVCLGAAEATYAALAGFAEAPAKRARIDTSATVSEEDSSCISTHNTA